MPIRIQTPLDDNTVEKLSAGDEVLISGILYTARDAAHKRLCSLIENGKPLPIDLAGQIIYFAGPTPPKPGKPIGSIGPTTSYRMDAYSPILLARTGLKGMIGKGQRSVNVVNAMIRHVAVYLAAVGGAGALISKSVIEAEIVAYPELGPEAVHRLTVRDFPVIVATDCRGSDLYKYGPEQYRVK
jgi:fumarate hydratase subunit beta